MLQNLLLLSCFRIALVYIISSNVSLVFFVSKNKLRDFESGVTFCHGKSGSYVRLRFFRSLISCFLFIKYFTIKGNNKYINTVNPLLNLEF